LLLAPVSAERASYSPILVLLATIAIVVLTIGLVHRFYHGRIRRAAPWDCGFPLQTARMQDTAEGFGQPIRQIFEPLYRMQRVLPSPFDAAPRYRVTVEDPIWAWSTCGSPMPSRRSRASSACCSEGGSRSTCSTASSRS
jgi:hypothetical protein